MTTSNGGVKNADAAGAPPPPSNFDLYAGDFSCDDDISFENLLQLDNDIDKPPPPPPPTSLHQSAVSPTGQLCRQPAAPVQSSSVAALPAADTVVYLLSTTALRPPSSAGDAVFDAVARNDVRPLLRFQISKRPTAAAVVGYGVELGGPIMTVGSSAQQRSPAGLGPSTAELASVTSVGNRVAAAGCQSTDVHQLHRRLALTTAFNGDLSTASQRPVVVAGSPTVTRPCSAKTSQPLTGVVSSKSKSAAAADARQTVQEKNAYEYERVMDILRYYRELVVERKLPGACLPCKRRKSKPLVSADPVTTISTRPGHIAPPSSTTTTSTRTVAVPVSQYVRPVAMTAWRGQSPTPSVTSAGKPTTVALTSTSRPPEPQQSAISSFSTTSDADLKSSGRTVLSAADEPPSRPSSVELGTVRSSAVNGELHDCSKDFTRTCSSAPGLCTDDNDGRPNPLTVFDHKTSVDAIRRRLSGASCGAGRRRTLRRSVDLRRFVNKPPPSFIQRVVTARQAQPATDSGDFESKDEITDLDVNVWMKQSLPVKHISTHTTDTVVVKWTKAHLAICGPYQSWT